MANGVEYVCVDQAALALWPYRRAAAYAPTTPALIAYILEDCGASMLFVDNPAYWERLAPEVESLASLKRVILASRRTVCRRMRRSIRAA